MRIDAVVARELLWVVFIRDECFSCCCYQHVRMSAFPQRKWKFPSESGKMGEPVYDLGLIIKCSYHHHLQPRA